MYGCIHSHSQLVQRFLHLHVLDAPPDSPGQTESGHELILLALALGNQFWGRFLERLRSRCGYLCTVLAR